MEQKENINRNADNISLKEHISLRYRQICRISTYMIKAEIIKGWQMQMNILDASLKNIRNKFKKPGIILRCDAT